MSAVHLLGLSQRDVAQRLSVDEGTLARWEKGEAQPTGERLATVEQVLIAPSIASESG